MAQKLKTRTGTGENQFTDAAELTGYFNVSLSGEWEGIITAQRSFDGGSTWFDVNTWTENTQEFGFEPEKGVFYRIGFKLAEYTSGTAIIRISQ